MVLVGLGCVYLRWARLKVKFCKRPEYNNFSAAAQTYLVKKYYCSEWCGQLPVNSGSHLLRPYTAP